MTNKLFVGGISYNTSEAQLSEYFGTVGSVISAKIITDKYSGQAKGFGFVEMASEEEAKRAMDKLNNTMLDNRTIVVKEALPQENRTNNNNRNFNNGGGGSYNRDRDRRQNRY